MGRPRNIEEVERLRDTAFELFAVKGLDATSYSDIAKNAYVTKSHVQHYFPKKEILVTLFVERSMEAVLKIARELPEFEAMDPLSKLVYVDYIQYYYAMYNEKMFRMSMDILLERSVTQAVIDAGIEFDLLHLMKYDEVSHPDELEDVLRFLYGGIYDRLYDCKSKGSDFSIEQYIAYGVRLLQPFVSTDVPESIVDGLKDLGPWLDERKAKYNRAMFGMR
ncbi:MAG: TetR/AcrR family transcriptional regulator [Clostridia bacterium]|jgi:Transcriptional regulator|nr:TetR/AcrR family transcriptional regulator [Clostridia bacterium]MBQ2567110.1 TetR/AcrR family transcriptional regulator [Clostridia bacterium]MBQ3996077.1 TetR/AcrR family transcriptional regulator [Clostridia bacterium]MBQ5480046.1 TetR/AcrR family transcriptional regulator [Clostridia bacterium]